MSLSVIVPTYNETDNNRPLTERLFRATRAAKLETELLVMDDESDGTAEGCADDDDRLTIELLLSGEADLPAMVAVATAVAMAAASCLLSGVMGRIEGSSFHADGRRRRGRMPEYTK